MANRVNPHFVEQLEEHRKDLLKLLHAKIATIFPNTLLSFHHKMPFALLHMVVVVLVRQGAGLLEQVSERASDPTLLVRRQRGLLRLTLRRGADKSQPILEPCSVNFL